MITNNYQNVQMNAKMNHFDAVSMNDQNQRKKIRDPFTPQEDKMLKELVSLYGNRNWRIVSSFLVGRSPKQCRDRYTNYLVPGFFTGEWSKEEDFLLVQLYSMYGPKWSILKNYYPNRSSNSIKNRWTYFLSRQTFVNNYEIQSKSIENTVKMNEHVEKMITNKVDFDFNAQSHKMSFDDISINMTIQNEDHNIITNDIDDKLDIFHPENDEFTCYEKELVGFDFNWM